MLIRRVVAAALVVCLGAVDSTRGQVWDVDLASAVLVEGEVYADTCANNNPPPAWPLPCAARPGPLEPVGVCPPFGVCAGVGGWAPGYPEWTLECPTSQTQLVATAVAGVQDLVAELGLPTLADDTDLFGPAFAQADANAFITVDGLGSRTLHMRCAAQMINTAVADEDYYTRGCAQLAASINAQAIDLPSTPVFVRYSWTAIGEADNDHECDDPIPPTQCTRYLLPLQEDPQASSILTDVDPGATGFPTTLADGDVFNTGLGPQPLWADDGDGGVPVPMGAMTYPVITSMAAISTQTLQSGPFGGESDDTSIQGTVTLFLISHDFITDEPFDEYMRDVPAGGQGPQYAFRVGRYEI
jgi:hypothetical protein